MEIMEKEVEHLRNEIDFLREIMKSSVQSIAIMLYIVKVVENNINTAYVTLYLRTKIHYRNTSTESIH